ncbi:MAG: hypothetical protein WDW38_010530 [Sanguina aurantia]
MTTRSTRTGGQPSWRLWQRLCPRPAPPAPPSEKTVHDVLAGAMARAASQGTIHPLDTMKVRLQTASRQSLSASAVPVTPARPSVGHALSELGSLYKGFVPTLLEDVPDMAVKFAVYESLRGLHLRLNDGQPPSVIQDLLMGGTAGAAAAAATTPLDVVKTRMMVSASSSPGLRQCVASVVAEGTGVKAFFCGVGPRALSNGLNSAIFFCFFEAIRRILNTRHAEAEALRLSQATSLHSHDLRATSPSHSTPGPSSPPHAHHRNSSSGSGGGSGGAFPASSSSTGAASGQPVGTLASSLQGSEGNKVVASVKLKPAVGTGGGGGGGGGGGRMACLSLALPLHPFPRRRCQEL